MRDDESAGPERGVTLSDLTDEQFLDNPGRGAAEGIGLLVFTSGNQATVNDNVVIKVTGKGRLLEIEEFQEDLGFDLVDPSSRLGREARRSWRRV